MLLAGRSAHMLMSDKERAVEQMAVLGVEVARARMWFERMVAGVEGALKSAKAACEGLTSQGEESGVLRGKVYYMGQHLIWLQQQLECARAFKW